MAFDWLPAVGAIAGGLLGGSSKGSEATRTTSMDPRMDRYVYGEDGKSGLLGGSFGLMNQQLASGGLNPMQQQGLNMQAQFLQSPQYQQGYGNMMNLGQSLLGAGVAGNPFTTGRSAIGAQGGMPVFQYTGSASSLPLQRVQMGGATEKQSTAPAASYGGTGSGGGGYAGQSRGGGYSSIPGGQGISSDVTAAALAAMAASENPAIRALSPSIAALLGFGGSAIAGQQADAMGEAGNKLADSQSLSNLGIGTVSDADGNVRTYSSPETIAAADALAFGVGPSWDDAEATKRAYLAQALGQGGSGGSYGRGGVFGRNNMAGDASGMGFGGQGGWGGFGQA